GAEQIQRALPRHQTATHGAPARGARTNGRDGEIAMPTFEGAVDGAGLHVAIVTARWNSIVTEILLGGAVKTPQGKGVAEDAIHTVRVPGAFEIPAAAQWAAVSGKIDAVICLGAVIRGETAHFEYVAGGAQQGILHVTHATGVPVVFGVLTVDTVEQAM